MIVLIFIVFMFLVVIIFYYVIWKIDESSVDGYFLGGRSLIVGVIVGFLFFINFLIE